MRKGIPFTIVLMACLMIGSTAFAGGWGPFFQWSRETPKAGFPDFLQDLLIEEMWKIPGITQADVDMAVAAMDAVDFDLALDHLVFGLLYDSAPSRDKLFNYRMSLGFDIATNLNVDGGLDTSPIPPAILPALGTLTGDIDDNSKYGVSWRHTFGFGILRNELLKWWVGPALNLNFNYWDAGGVEAATLSIGGGAETGVNIHLGSSFSVCVGGGILWDAFGYAIGVDEVGSLVWGNGPFYFLQVSVLLHTGQDQTAWQQ